MYQNNNNKNRNKNNNANNSSTSNSSANNSNRNNNPNANSNKNNRNNNANSTNTNTSNNSNSTNRNSNGNSNGNYYKKNNNYKGKYFNKNNKPQKTVEQHEKEYIEKRELEDDANKPTCPICNEKIHITEEAIKHAKTGDLAHFGCILKEIESDNKIENKESIVYLGAGTFGIIETKESGNSKHPHFTIRKKINYEDRKIKRIKDEIDIEEEELFNV